MLHTIKNLQGWQFSCLACDDMDFSALPFSLTCELQGVQSDFALHLRSLWQPKAAISWRDSEKYNCFFSNK